MQKTLLAHRACREKMQATAEAMRYLLLQYYQLHKVLSKHQENLAEIEEELSQTLGLHGHDLDEWLDKLQGSISLN